MTVALSWVVGVTDVKHATVFDMISWNILRYFVLKKSEVGWEPTVGGYPS